MITIVPPFFHLYHIFFSIQSSLSEKTHTNMLVSLISTNFTPKICFPNKFSPSSSSSSCLLTICPPLTPCSSPRPPTRIMVSDHHSLSPLPDDRTVVGCGGASMDYLVMVDGFPKPDDKIRSTSYKVQGGGNVGNALTCAARLGLQSRIIAKVRVFKLLKILKEEPCSRSLKLMVSKEGRSMFSYVIVDSKMKTRTPIYQPGYPPMTPDDFIPTDLSSALNGARLVYFDGLSLKTALVVAHEAWTMAPSIPSALVSMLIGLPKLKFVVVTLGEEGCLMLQRTHNADDAKLEEMDVDQCLASLNQRKDFSVTFPTCISSPVLKLEAHGIGAVTGRLFVGTAQNIPPSELVDTTGAGDAFVGSVLYALCTDMPPEIMLPFAAQVASGCCRYLGARTGLPHRTDPCLKPFLGQKWQIEVAL